MQYLEKLFNSKTIEEIKYIYTVWVINSELEYLKYFLEITDNFSSLHSRIAYLFNTAKLYDAIYDYDTSLQANKKGNKQLTAKQKELLEEFITLICKSSSESEAFGIINSWLKTTSMSFIKEVIPRTVRFHFFSENKYIFNETLQYFFFFANKNKLNLNLSNDEVNRILIEIPRLYYDKNGLVYQFWEKEKNYSPFEIPF